LAWEIVMAINRDKSHLWKADIARSVDYYNDRFMNFAPETYRNQREKQTNLVEQAMLQTENLRHISPNLLRQSPLLLQMLRMTTAPPLARDRLIGLAYVTPNLVQSMEETQKHDPRVPPHMPEEQLQEELERICEVIEEMVDRDICPWLETDEEPEREGIRRAASVFADRLCGTAADPIIRNAQEQEQKEAIREWLVAREYEEVDSASVSDVLLMEPGTFTFGCTVQVPVGDRMSNLPVDCILRPHRSKVGDVPVFMEMKSAGDYTNPNKRRKEEAQKANQLRRKYGNDVSFILFLRGYFNSSYLGYEAAELLDWVWEHRIEDLAELGLDKGSSGAPRGGTAGDPDPGSGEPDSEPQVWQEEQPSEGEQPQISHARRTRYLKESEIDRYLPTLVTSVIFSDRLHGEKEKRRLEIQKELDQSKSQEERNRLGQFSTPPALADEIVQTAKELLTKGGPIDFLEPAFGTGSFFSALLRNLDQGEIGRCQGYEIDPHYGKRAQELWQDTPLKLKVADFTLIAPPESATECFDLIMTNPPYVRHHHIRTKEKSWLRSRARQIIGSEPSGLSGLYTYFVYLAHPWLREGGIGAWLIPSEFMYVNYGSLLRDYLLRKVTLLRIHLFDPQEVLFDDALVSSSVILLRKEKPRGPHRVLVTSGGSLTEPSLSHWISTDYLKRLPKWRNLFQEPGRDKREDGWIRLEDIFLIKRGLATGANDFFIMRPEEAEKRNLPSEFLRPILPSPRHLDADEVDSRDGYMPDIQEQRVLLSCNLAEEEIRDRYPALWEYLQEGKQEGVHERYLCRHRSPWYSQEEREAAPLLCSYMGRVAKNDKPFRFILNRSAAVVPNTYLNLYPTHELQLLLAEQPNLVERILEALRELSAEDLVSNGRTYGGGLHKMEPKELGNVRIHVKELDGIIKNPCNKVYCFL
jgi:adenine-specific DNA-methyltransferase